MSTRARLLLCGLGVLAGVPGCTCGTGPGGTDAAMPGSDAAMPGTDAADVFNVPMPGAVYADIQDVEPNDSPDTAEAGGTISAGYWGTAFSTQTLGGADVVDFVSFATSGTTADLINLPIAPCWDAGLGVDLIDWWVYRVTPGAPLEEITSSITPATDCEGGYIDLPGGTWYLLELRTPLASIPAPAATQYFW